MAPDNWRYFAPWIMLSLASAAILLYAIEQDRWLYCDDPCGHDLIGHWVAGGMPEAQQAYDKQLLADRMESQFDYRPRLLHYFYPPHHLLAMRPLSALPYRAVEFIHIAASLLAWFGTLLLATRNLRLALAGLLAGGGILYSLWWVQHGMLFSAALFCGIFLAARKPALSGALLAMATVKPSLGLLVPAALVAARKWSVIGYGAAFASVFVAMSLIAFGMDPWEDWIAELGDASAIAAGSVMRSRFQNLLNLIYPFGPGLAVGIHVAVAAAACLLTLKIWARKNSEHMVRVSALALTSLLIPPYIYMYDLPMVSAVAMMLWTRPDINRLERLMLPTAVAVTILPMDSGGGPISILMLLLVTLRIDSRSGAKI